MRQDHAMKRRGIRESGGSVSALKRRFSPRLHQAVAERELNGDGSFTGRRVSPRLHINRSETEGHSEKDIVSNGSLVKGGRLRPRAADDNCPPSDEVVAAERRLSPRRRLYDHNSPQRKKQLRGDLGAENGVSLSPRRVLHNHPRKRESKDSRCVKQADGDRAANDESSSRVMHNHPGKGQADDAGRGEAEGERAVKDQSSSKDAGCVKQTAIEGEGDRAVKDGCSSKSAIARVKETLRIFNTHYLHFMQEEEDRVRKAEAELINGKDKIGSNSKNKKCSKRPDLKAITKMIETNAILYPEKQFGDLPGIVVGYRFYSRAEMVAVGFHNHWLNGIDYIGISSQKPEGYKEHTFPLAVSIVLSGQYEDDFDNSEEIVYTGQGGNDLLGNKRQIEDQSLLRGNLALKNNIEQDVPVRVTRGHRCSDSYSGKVYTYDGLYKVVEYWVDKGLSQHTVFKYRLKRVGGQSRLTTNQVQFSRGHGKDVLSASSGLICSDISNGLEHISIPVTNVIDDPPIGITVAGFTYSKCMQVAESVKLPPKAPGCDCKGNCTNPKTCACAKLNGSDFPYVLCRDGGRLVEARDVVFECGANCGCGPGCINRTSQRELKYHLEVYRTADKGWAVRSWDFIPSGAPVCEYIGVLRRSDELDNVSENDYIFEIDCWQTIKEFEGRERRFKGIPVPASCLIPTGDEEEGGNSSPEFCLDAGSTGNVTRFINHSCEPNLFVQCVLSSHHDIRLARVVLFAADNIPPLQELAYDYGYALDSVIGADGKIKVLPCLCGASDCRKRLY
ncbi:Histone-lysine N-methyltransferase, H3 lysine-9 specific suvh4 [Dionaea muscipula]